VGPNKVSEKRLGVFVIVNIIFRWRVNEVTLIKRMTPKNTPECEPKSFKEVKPEKDDSCILRASWMESTASGGKWRYAALINEDHESDNRICSSVD
jgi:hypothetical protein